MKKVYLMMTLAATALLSFVACGGDDNDDLPDSGKGTNVELSSPAYKDEATTINITGDNADGIKQLRMMESGAYMITREGANLTRSTRAGNDELTYEFGKYTYSSGKYTFDNGMTISYEPSGKNYDVSITWKSGTTIKTTGTLDPGSSVPTGVQTDNLCSRPWTIERVMATAVAGTTKLGKEFKVPINLYDVKAWYEENFGTLKDQFDANTIILGIYFDSKGLFAINYQNRKADVGVWRWQQMDLGNLTYAWNDKAHAISLFTGSASVSFEKAPERCKLILKGNVDGTDMEFVFTLR